MDTWGYEIKTLQIFFFVLKDNDVNLHVREIPSKEKKNNGLGAGEDNYAQAIGDCRLREPSTQPTARSLELGWEEEGRESTAYILSILGSCKQRDCKDKIY